MGFASITKETLFAALAGLTLTGCVAEEPWTRERQAQVTTMSLPVAPSASLRAVERAVRELDPRSTSFDFSSDGFRATRSFNEFMIVAAMQGTYLYDVRVQSAGAGSSITIRIYTSGSAITATGVSPTGGSMWQDDDAYRLLFDRTRYHAGLTSEWLSCEEARSKYGTAGAIEPICLGAVARDPAK